MDKPDLSKWIAGGINALSLIIVMLVTAILSPAFSLSFYEYEFDKNGTYAVVQMEKEDFLAVRSHMLDYMRGKEEKLNMMTTVNGEDRLFFSEREVVHMRDVKDLLELCYLIRNIAIVLFILSLAVLIFRGEWKKYIFKSWKIGSLCTFALFVFMGLLVSINFDAAFTIFHEIFFRNDLWMLDPNVDLLVNMVPLPFFIDITIYIAALFSFFLCGMFAAGAVLSREKR